MPGPAGRSWLQAKAHCNRRCQVQGCANARGQGSDGGVVHRGQRGNLGGGCVVLEGRAVSKFTSFMSFV